MKLMSPVSGLVAVASLIMCCQRLLGEWLESLLGYSSLSCNFAGKFYLKGNM